jgi:hypothetical protein
MNWTMLVCLSMYVSCYLTNINECSQNQHYLEYICNKCSKLELDPTYLVNAKI